MAHVLPNFASGRRARPLWEVRQKATGGGAEVMGGVVTQKRGRATKERSETPIAPRCRHCR